MPHAVGKDTIVKSRLLVVLVLVVAPVTVLGAAQENGQYGGVENCKMCHPDIATDWAKTSHARSYELLVNVGKEKTPECLPCHTTGYGKGGFVDAATSPELKGTTCEACHGPGADHMGDKAKIIRSPSGKVCSSCHQDTGLHAMPAP